MNRNCLLVAVAVAVVSLGAPERLEAQSSISAEAVRAAQVAAGTARILSTPVVTGDSIVVRLQDTELTLDALMGGGWRLGGRDGSPRAVGRTIAEALRSGLPARSRVRLVRVDVAGPTLPGVDPRSEFPSSARVSLPYEFAEPTAP